MNNPNLRPIQPIEIPALGVAMYLYVQANAFSASAKTSDLYFYLADESGKLLVQDNYSLNEEEFGAWGADNEYLVALIAEKKNLTLLPFTPETQE